ncbi:MAG: DUF4249 family protein [Bacteroidales bacterium]|jgi:hypothetical protein
MAGLPGCVSDIDIQPKDTEPVYVIEGWIEQGNFPRVLVSRSLPYSSTAGLADLFDLLVSDAEVTVTSGSEKEVLSLVKDTMYAELPIYRGFSIRGEIGKAYNVEVKIGDKVYTSTDTILKPVRPDSVWYKPEPQDRKLGIIHVSLTDPPEPGNFYRIFYKRLGLDMDYISIIGNMHDDQLFNGTQIDFLLNRTALGITRPEDVFFHEGETVVVKTCCISHRYFDFLTSMISESGITMSPLNIESRAISLFEGGALGGWGCYAIALDTVEIKQTGIW